MLWCSGVDDGAKPLWTARYASGVARESESESGPEAGASKFRVSTVTEAEPCLRHSRPSFRILAARRIGDYRYQTLVAW